MTLDIAVIGAGIGGLSAAVALKQAGHRVKIFEKSAFATEIGAALTISPNGVKVLEHIGFSIPRARGRLLPSWDVVDGLSLRKLSSLDLSSVQEQYGSPFIAVHRVDFHKELLRLALESEPAALSVELKLSAEVTKVDAQTGTLYFLDGTQHTSDLIIGADGLHSVARNVVLEGIPYQPGTAEYSAFRMLIPTKQVAEAAHLQKLMEWKSPGVQILADTSSKDRERHLTWYDCQEGEIQNLVGIHPTRPNQQVETNVKAALLDEFKHYDPDVVKLLQLADEVKRWPLSYYEPFPRWSSGRVVLIGDAAHPMLPFSGQAANLALEDSGALSVFIDSELTPEHIPARLELFEQGRKSRAAVIQVVSSARAGQEAAVEDKLWKYAGPDATDVPNTFPKRIHYAFSYDVFNSSKATLELWRSEQ